MLATLPKHNRPPTPQWLQLVLFISVFWLQIFTKLTLLWSVEAALWGASQHRGQYSRLYGGRGHYPNGNDWSKIPVIFIEKFFQGKGLILVSTFYISSKFIHLSSSLTNSPGNQPPVCPSSHKVYGMPEL